MRSGPLAGRVALVTGASRGVGAAVAAGLAERGAAVALVARSSRDLDVQARGIEERGGAAAAFAGDVRHPSFAEQTVDSAESTLGPLDLLVNAAGTAEAIGPLWEADPEIWWSDVESNLRGTFAFARAALARMVPRRAGRVVNVSSYVGIRPSPYLTSYAAAKTAIINLTESLAAETAEHGVAVFAVTPGYVRTAMIEHMLSSAAGRRWLPHVRDGKPVDLQRVVDLVAFLASGAADGLSGRFLHSLDDVRGLARSADAVRKDETYVLRMRRRES